MTNERPVSIVPGRDRPTCAMSSCDQPAYWIALAEERRGDEYVGPTDVPLCETHALESMTPEP